MSVRDGLWWRPLLGARRDELRAALREAGIAWREDETNRDRRFDRNRIRLDVLPALGVLNPRVVDALARAAALAADDEAVLDGLARAAAGGIAGRSPRRDVSLEGAGLAGLGDAVARRVVRLALKEALGTLRGLELRHVEAVRALAGEPTGRAVDLPGGSRARAERDRIVIRPPRGGGPSPATLTVPGEVAWEGGRLVARALDADALPDDPARACGPRRALLAAGRATGPLTVRGPRAGDRFRPLGGPGERLVADFLRDAGVAAPDREHVPIVLAGDRIAWVGGHRIDARFRLEGRTEGAVEIAWERP